VWGQSEDKELHIIPERWHVIVKEPGNEEVLRCIIAWMDRRLPDGPCRPEA
jgi:esterase/lipase